MQCPACGQVVQGSERFCVNCGTALAAPAPAASAPAPAAAAAQPAPERLAGVRGLLLLFCIWIAIINPLQQLQVLPYLRGAGLDWNVAAGFVLTVYGIFTGVQLWRRRPQAMALLRIYFAAYLLLMFAGWLGLFLFVTRHTIDVGPWVWLSFLRSFAFLAIWAPYFKLSRRVRATYGRNLW